MTTPESPAAAPATIQDVAREAGCSTATVSRVLNRHPHVSAAARDAVMRAVATLNFTPLRATRARRERNAAVVAPSRMVEFVLHRTDRYEPVHNTPDGLVFESPRPWRGEDWGAPEHRMDAAFFLNLFAGASQEAAAHGRKTLYHHTADPLADPDLAAAEGPPIVLAGHADDRVRAFVARCARPLVLLDVMVDGRVPVVTTDNHEGVRQAMDHLLALGHRRIALVGGHAETVAYEERRAAYRHALIEAGLGINPAYEIVKTVLMVEAEAALEALFASERRPTAVLAVNDWLALAALKAAARSGLSTPRDVSVVGFDDVDPARLFRPPLTTVRVDTAALGRLAVRTLLQLGDAGGVERYQQRLSPRLILRESTAPPREG